MYCTLRRQPQRAHNKLWTPLTRPSRSTRRVLTDGGINTQMCIGNQTLALIMTYTHPWNFCQLSTHSWFLPHRARCGTEMPTNWFQKQRLQRASDPQSLRIRIRIHAFWLFNNLFHKIINKYCITDLFGLLFVPWLQGQYLFTRKCEIPNFS